MKACKNCNGRIQSGKVYSKKDMESAWYIVIDIIEENVFYRKMNVTNIKYEKDVGFEIQKMNISEFKEKFKHETTIYCEHMIHNADCLKDINIIAEREKVK
jgi:hypothetical protein